MYRQLSIPNSKEERKEEIKYINLHISSAFGLYCLHEVTLPPAMSTRLCKNSAVAFRMLSIQKHLYPEIKIKFNARAFTTL